jgi:protein-tyrosine sulfotransferase
MPQPVFVISCHRSGSTLLRLILDSHDQIACPPESKFISGLEAFTNYPQVWHALSTLGLKRRDTMRHLRTITESILMDYTRSRGKRRWIDKTPNYFRLISFIDELFEGEALFIVLVRHPLDCVASLYEIFPSSTHFDPDITEAVRKWGNNLLSCARYWCYVYDEVASGMNRLSSRVHITRYEELVTSPSVVISDLLAFIGESYVDGLVERTFNIQHDQGFQDKKIETATRIHSDSVGRWRTWSQDEIEHLWTTVQTTAERYGYSLL